jgi:SPP1 family predicted phage head-tail adaptor
MTTTVKSGARRHKVELQRKTITQDPNTGEMVTTWTTYATPWVNMHYQSVREFVAAGAAQSEVSGYALMLFRDDVGASDRIVYRGKAFGLLGVMPDNESGREHITTPYSEGVRLDQ